MKSTVRSRSVSRSRIVKRSNLYQSGEALDPFILLGDILPGLTTTDIPLAVVLSDGDSSVSYLLSVFLTKDYEVVDDKVVFGFKRLNVKDLRAKIEFNITIDPDN